ECDRHRQRQKHRPDSPRHEERWGEHGDDAEHGEKLRPGGFEGRLIDGPTYSLAPRSVYVDVPRPHGLPIARRPPGITIIATITPQRTLTDGAVGFLPGVPLGRLGLKLGRRS